MKKFALVAASGLAVVLGGLLGYKLATDTELRQNLIRGAQDIFHISKQRVDEMTEEVAVKTAKMTKNPKINQDWVANQWEQIGL